MYKIYCLSHGGISSEQLFTPLFKVMFFFGPHPAVLQPDSIQVCGKGYFLHFFLFPSVLVLGMCHPSWTSLYFYPSQHLLKVSENPAGKCGS